MCKIEFLPKKIHKFECLHFFQCYQSVILKIVVFPKVGFKTPLNCYQGKLEKYRSGFDEFA